MDPEPLKRARQTPPEVPGYKLEGVLGRGATGVVYRARQLSVDRVVALKVLHRDLVGTPSAIRRLQREARTTARLAHPNIISAIDMGEQAGFWWYAMNLVEGESLSARLERGGKLSEREAIKLFAPLCDALEHARENGVVHRDIKPANILIEKGQRALLVDLGLAFVEDDPGLTRLGGTLGTPHYISPEQARDPSSADTQSDIWSLGATLYHALCGRPPFTGRSVAEILSNVLYARIEDPLRLAPNLSKGMALVLRKCLTRDPAYRYATPAELLADLERLRERRQVKVQRLHLDPVVVHGRDRLRRGLAVGVPALALAVALLSWWAPWRVEEPADGGVQEVAEWTPLEEAARLGRGDPSMLARALGDLDRMLPSLPERYQGRWAEVQAELTGALRSEVERVRVELDPLISVALREGRWSEVERLLGEEQARRVARRTGFRAGQIPGGVGVQFAGWLSRHEAELESRRGEALAAKQAKVLRWYQGPRRQELDELLRERRFRSAQKLLDSSAREMLLDADVSDEGLGAAEVEQLVKPLRDDVEADRTRFRNVWWWEFDGDLRQRVITKAEELLTAVEAGADADGRVEELEAFFAQTKEDLGFAESELPVGLVYRAGSEFEARRRELEAKVAAALEGQPERLWQGQQEMVSSLWEARHYSEIAGVFGVRLEDPEYFPVADHIRLRLREAELLGELLTRAAARLVEQDGEQESARIGSIHQAGRLRAGSDPLGDGFHLEIGEVRRFLALRVLRGAQGETPVLLDPDDVERLARLAPRPMEPESERLARALFRYHEGDLEGAATVLDTGALPREGTDAALVADLRRRLDEGRVDARSERFERRGYVARQLEFVRDERDSRHSVSETLERIRALLTDYTDVLEPAELVELREIRDELSEERGPKGRQDFERIFAPEELEWLPHRRVRMTFRLPDRAPSLGTFERGEWGTDGRGWILLAPARSDTEMLDTRPPRLLLREPVDLAAGVTRVVLELEQPKDSVPDLLIVSAAGFHVALVGAHGREPARILADVGDVRDVVAPARAGEGERFGGLQRGAGHLLELELRQQRGIVSVSLDGKRVLRDVRLRSPKGEPESASLAVRSRERVRVLRVTVEAGRE